MFRRLRSRAAHRLTSFPGQRMRVWAAIGIAFLAASVQAQPAPARFTLDNDALAEKIIQRLDLQPGETFLAVAHPGLFEGLIPHLRYQAMRAGAIDLGVIDVLAEPVPEDFDEATLRQGGSAAREKLREVLTGVDASVMLPGTIPDHPVYAAIQDLLRSGSGRTIHFHWLESGSAVALPGQPLPPRHVMEAAYQRAVLETDYAALAAHQRRFVAAMRDGVVRVTTPAGTDLRFRIGDRPVNYQDGVAAKATTDQGVILVDREIELPAGAVRVAPLEESVSGTIVFPPSQWSGRPVHGLALTFEAGRIASVSADLGHEAVLQEIDIAGEAGRSFREFALGFNPLLAVPERGPWIPYYGYGDGVVRLSLGDNSELGGRVGGGYVRWNFFTDATVSIDAVEWVRAGKLVR